MGNDKKIQQQKQQHEDKKKKSKKKTNLFIEKKVKINHMVTDNKPLVLFVGLC